MKKITFAVLILFSTSLFAQLNGIKTIPGNFPTIASAISSLNAQGVGAGGVIFNVSADYSETFANISDGLITAIGTVGSPIVFQKSGSGANPVIIAAMGNSISLDGIIVIRGGDHITFNGIDLMENPSNTNPAQQMEWGYALLKQNETNGSQYNSINNCTITLNKTNPNSVGIYSGNHTNLNKSTIYVSNSSGTNSNNKINGNTISNVYYGIYIDGYADSNIYEFYDLNNEIGLTSGNSITNFAGAINPAAGIYIRNNNLAKVANNIITTTGAKTHIRGIYLAPSFNASIDVIGNSISLSGIVETNTTIGIESAIKGKNNTINLINNTIHDCVNTSATLGAFYGIINSDSCYNVTIYNNNIIHNSLSGLGTLTGIDGGNCTNLNIIANTIRGNKKTDAPGYMYCTKAGNANIVFNNNVIDSNSIVMVNEAYSTAYYIFNISYLYGYFNYGTPITHSYDNNIVSNLLISDLISNYESTIYGFKINSAATNTTISFTNNTLHDLKYSTTASGSASIYGFEIHNRISALNIFKNKIYKFEADGKNSFIVGLGVFTGATTCNIYNNSISELYTPTSNKSEAISGITISGYSGMTTNLFNNTIYLSANSTGQYFGSNGINSAATINMKNNIIVNKSIPGPDGFTSAYQRSSISNSTHLSSSNNNCYYVNPSSGHSSILYLNLNSLYYTVGDFQSVVSPGESLSFSEDVPFVNVSTSPFDLHIKTDVPSLCESRGISITSPILLNEDMDGDPRGSTTDVGADEFSGISTGLIFPQSLKATPINSKQNKITYSLNQSNNNIVIVWNNTGIFTTPTGVPPTVVGSAFAGGNFLFNGAGSTITHSGLTNATTYYYKAFSYDGANYSGGITDSAATKVFPPLSLSSNAVGTTQINLVWSKNSNNDNVIVARNSSNTFGTPSNGTPLNVNNNISGGGTLIYTGPLSAFNDINLTNNTNYFYKIWSIDPYNFYSSTGLTDSATTFTCSPLTALPLVESFDDTLNFPSCWTNKQTVGSGTSNKWNIVSRGTYPNCIPQSGNGMIQFNSHNFAYGVKAILATPPLNIPTDSYQVSFWIYKYNSAPYSDFVNVYFNSEPTTDGATFLGTATRSITYSPIENVDSIWYQYSFNLPTGSAGNNRFIVFEGIRGSFYGYNLFLDDIKVEPQPLCGIPDSLAVSDISTTQATIEWDAAGLENGWNIEYGPIGFIQGTGTIIPVTANSHTITGLTPNTEYSAYIQANCGGSNGVGNWSNAIVFKTQCNEINAFPYNESFAGAVFPPACWGNYSVLYPTSGSAWKRATVGTSPVCSPHSDSVMAFFNSNNYYSGVNALLITPMLSLPSENYQVKFWMYRDNGQPTKMDKINIYFNNEPSLHGASMLGTIYRNNSLAPIETVANQWYQYSYNVPNGAVVNNGYFILEGVSAFGNNIFVDDVSIEVKDLCSEPNLLTSTSITNSETMLSWNACDSETSWNVEYGVIGFTQGSGTTVSTSSPNLTINGLNPNLTYSFYVQANCGGVNGTSSWAGPTPFSTACAPISTFPYSESFDGTTFAPSCWLNYQTVVSSSANIWSRSTSETTPSCLPHSGAGMAKYSKSSTSIGTKPLLVLPPMNFSNQLYQVDFWMFRDYYMALPNEDIVNVYYNSSPTTTEAVLLGTINRNIYLAPIEQIPFKWYHYSFNLPEGCSGNNRYVIFEAVSSTSYKILIDDITVGLQPNCSPPTNVSASVLSASEVSLNWNAGGDETEWVIQYDTAGFNLGTGAVVTANTNPYSLTGLIANKSYSYYIKSSCGGADGVSQWVGPFGFTTLCNNAITTYPYLEGFENTTFSPSCWTNRQTSGLGNIKTWNNSGSGLSASSHGGSRKAVFNCYNYSNNTKAELITPPLNLPTDSYKVSFWMYRDNTYLSLEDSLNVYYNTIPGISGGTLLGTIHRNLSLSPVEQNISQWIRYSFNMPIGSSGNSRYVLLEAVSQNGNNILIDDFTVEAQSAYPPPSNITVSQITENSATINWTAGGAETSWNIEYGLVGFAKGSGTTISTTTNPNLLTGLTQGTTYSIYIQADYGVANGLSEWIGPISFTTQCLSITNFPYIQSFDSIRFPPPCWLNLLEFGSSQYNTWDRLTTGGGPTCTPHSGAGMAAFDCFDAPSGVKSILVTPTLILPSDNYRVNFWMYRNNGLLNFDDSVNVYYNTNPNKSGATLLGSIHRNNLLSPYEEIANKWYQYSFNMPAGSSGNNSYVIIEAVSKKGQYIHIDDVEIGIIPPCPAPRSLVVNSVVGTSATLSWTAQGNETSWNIEYGVSGFIHGTGTVITVNTNPYTLLGLPQNKSYSFYVQANCGTTDGNSTWIGPNSFTIPCQTITNFPFVENFDDTTFAPTCWTNIGSNGTSTSYLWKRVSTTTHPVCLPHSGSGMALYNSYNYGSGSSAILATPSLDLNSDFYKVGFWMYRDDGAPTYYDNVEVYFNDTLSLTGATLIGRIYRSSNMAPVEATPNQWYEYAFNLPANSTGTNKYVIFKGNGNYGNNIYIDDINIDLSDCIKPKNISISGQTSSEATINWTNGSNETEWVIEYGPTGFVQGSGTSITVTTKPYTITGLTSGTNYSAYIKSNCGGAIGSSDWTEPYDFYTLCPSISSFSAISNTSTSALLGWVNDSPATDWSIEYGLDGFLQGFGTTVSATTNPFNIMGLAPGTTYSAYIRTECSNDSSIQMTPWVGPLVFNTLCPAVASVVSTGITHNSVILSWIPSGNETAWNLQYKKATDPTYIQIPNTSVIPYTLLGLESNVAYVWNVQAICNNSTISDWSADNVFNTAVGISENGINGLIVYSYNNMICITNKNKEWIDEVVVFDMLGREVGKFAINNSENVLINTDYSTSSYIIKVVTKNQVGTTKLHLHN